MDLIMKKFKVSTSEVATFLTCRQRWMYAHHPSYNLEPRTLGIALTRGLAGHKALEIYYKSIMDGNSRDDSAQAANDYIVSESLKSMQVDDVDKMNAIISIGKFLQQYFDEHLWVFDVYNVVGVEALVEAQLPESDILFAGRVDLLFEVKNGANRGEIVPWDHKFCYNFWSEGSLKMNPQLRNYVWALVESGYRSRVGYMNMIRYRDNAQDRFKQENITSTKTIRDLFISNHTQAAESIVQLKKQKHVGISEGVTRSASKFNCEYCPFINLCHTEASGEDASTMIKASYRPNSYGYDSELDVD
jgi:PD-(D/E)XK nuclease superfamily